MSGIDTRNLLIVILGAALIAALVTGRGDSALATGGTDSNGDMIAVTGDYGNGTSVLWVIDTKSKQLAAYRSINGSTIELVGARRITWDLKLQGFRDRTPEGFNPAALEKQYLDYEAGRARSAVPAGGAPGAGEDSKEK